MILEDSLESYTRLQSNNISFNYEGDYQGNNVAVQTTSVVLAQTTDYYPYGDPWREPSGQPWLSPYSYCGGDPGR